MTDQQTRENLSSDDLDRVLAELTPDQIRFVVARQEHNTHKEAAESLDIPVSRVYQWISAGVQINEAVKLMALDGLVTALHVRKRNLAKAMLVKVGGLDSEDERTRQNVATEVIEWEMGKATQPSEVSGRGGKPIEHKHSGTVGVTVYVPDNGRDDRDPTATGAAGEVPGDSG